MSAATSVPEISGNWRGPLGWENGLPAIRAAAQTEFAGGDTGKRRRKEHEQEVEPDPAWETPLRLGKSPRLRGGKFTRTLRPAGDKTTCLPASQSTAWPRTVTR